MTKYKSHYTEVNLKMFKELENYYKKHYHNLTLTQKIMHIDDFKVIFI